MAKKINFQQVAKSTLAVGAGAVAGEFVAGKVLGKMNGMISGLILTGAGAFAPSLIGGKNDVLADAGKGLIAVGATRLAKHFMPDMFDATPTPPVKGLGEIGAQGGYVIDEDFETVRGVDDEYAVGSPDDVAVGDVGEDYEY